MSTKVQVILDDHERQRFQREAARQGVSLSAWMREAARDRLATLESRRPFDAETLQLFFAECDRREVGREPDWEEHRRVIAESLGSGATGT
jgi:hypothetical protein